MSCRAVCDSVLQGFAVVNTPSYNTFSGDPKSHVYIRGMLQYVAECCAVVQCVAVGIRFSEVPNLMFSKEVCCSMLRCVTLSCSREHTFVEYTFRRSQISRLQKRCVAVCRSVLRCVAVMNTHPWNTFSGDPKSHVYKRGVSQCVAVCYSVMQS